jgi:hypothetical protein
MGLVEVFGEVEELWKSPTPSKVVAFSWKLLWDHIPTKKTSQLVRLLTLWWQQTVCGVKERWKHQYICFYIVTSRIGCG